MRQLALDKELIIFFLLERREPHGIPRPCGHSCMVCATVCLAVMPSFSDITNVSTIDHSFKTDRSHTHLFHVTQYGDDIIGRELNLRKLPGCSWSRTTTFRTAVTDNDKDQSLTREPYCIQHTLIQELMYNNLSSHDKSSNLYRAYNDTSIDAK